MTGRMTEAVIIEGKVYDSFAKGRRALIQLASERTRALYQRQGYVDQDALRAVLPVAHFYNERVHSRPEDPMELRGELRIDLAALVGSMQRNAAFPVFSTVEIPAIPGSA